MVGLVLCALAQKTSINQRDCSKGPLAGQGWSSWCFGRGCGSRGGTGGTPQLPFRHQWGGDGCLQQCMVSSQEATEELKQGSFRLDVKENLRANSLCRLHRWGLPGHETRSSPEQPCLMSAAPAVSRRFYWAKDFPELQFCGPFFAVYSTSCLLPSAFSVPGHCEIFWTTTTLALDPSACSMVGGWLHFCSASIPK